MRFPKGYTNDDLLRHIIKPFLLDTLSEGLRRIEKNGTIDKDYDEETGFLEHVGQAILISRKIIQKGNKWDPDVWGPMERIDNLERRYKSIKFK